MTLNPKNSVRQIRARLLRVLVISFAAIVLLIVTLLLGVLVYSLNDFSTSEVEIDPPQVRVLEGYYVGRGSWQGVEAVAQGPRWQDILVLDANGVVVMDSGRIDTVLVGQPFTNTSSFPSSVPVRLETNGQMIGTVVLGFDRSFTQEIVVAVILALAVPVGIVSVFLALLALLIGLLVTRRFINPLADVIAVAQAVASGDLSARVAVRGPGDLRVLMDSFNHMAGALEQSDLERRNLLADVAHELRTPLTVMRGKLEGIVDGVYPANESTIAPVLEETYTLERLVEDLRTLTLAETRQLNFDVQPVILSGLVERALSLFSAEAQEKSITLTLVAAPDAPTVQADPQRVSQVLGNLVANALKYVPAGGQVQVNVTAKEAGAEVAVIDNGPGLPDADLPHLFDRFWRGEKSRARASGGAGLGLAIARQLIEAQGGQVMAENVAGGGLRVAFWLPAVNKS
ncbi:MAG: HAMP domain-containing protein [Anaerolineales bacterium]|nr:HAMP domain-containing protein [Anaerolineales bacterium]